MLSLLLQALIDFGSPTDVATWDAKAEVVDGRLRVRTGGREPWAGVTLKGAWDLSRFGRVSADVFNTGAARSRSACGSTTPGPTARLTACSERSSSCPARKAS